MASNGARGYFRPMKPTDWERSFPFIAGVLLVSGLYCLYRHDWWFGGFIAIAGGAYLIRWFFDFRKRKAKGP